AAGRGDDAAVVVGQAALVDQLGEADRGGPAAAEANDGRANVRRGGIRVLPQVVERGQTELPIRLFGGGMDGGRGQHRGIDQSALVTAGTDAGVVARTDAGVH